jgi:hypothetical protein
VLGGFAGRIGGNSGVGVAASNGFIATGTGGGGGRDAIAGAGGSGVVILKWT